MDKAFTGSISGVSNEEMGIINELPPSRNAFGVGAGLVVGRLLTVGEIVGESVGGCDGAADIDGGEVG